MDAYVWPEILLQNQTVLCQYFSKSDILYKLHLFVLTCKYIYIYIFFFFF